MLTLNEILGLGELYTDYCADCRAADLEPMTYADFVAVVVEGEKRAAQQ